MRGMMALYPQDSNPSGHAAVDAIKAGADVLMVPANIDAAFQAILAAVRSNEISENRIDGSVTRILEMKAAAGLDKSRFVDVNEVKRLFPDAEAEKVAQKVADEAVTLVRSNGRLLPLAQKESKNADAQKSRPDDGGKRLAVVSFVDSRNSRLGHEFDQQLKSRRPDARIYHYYNDQIGSDVVPSEVLKSAKTIVVAAFVTHVPGRQVMSHGRPTTAVGLSGQSAEFLEDIVATMPQKTVVVALGSPYLIQNYPTIQNYISTYSLVPTAEIAAVKSLFGEIQNHAKLPVTLPGIAPRGFALRWPTAPPQRAETIH
jgi:beta-N-acetylhexosaminidase